MRNLDNCGWRQWLANRRVQKRRCELQPSRVCPEKLVLWHTQQTKKGIKLGKHYFFLFHFVSIGECRSVSKWVILLARNRFLFGPELVQIKLALLFLSPSTVHGQMLHQVLEMTCRSHHIVRVRTFHGQHGTWVFFPTVWPKLYFSLSFLNPSHISPASLLANERTENCSERLVQTSFVRWEVKLCGSSSHLLRRLSLKKRPELLQIQITQTLTDGHVWLKKKQTNLENRRIHDLLLHGLFSHTFVSSSIWKLNRKT